MLLTYLFGHSVICQVDVGFIELLDSVAATDKGKMFQKSKTDLGDASRERLYQYHVVGNKKYVPVSLNRSLSHNVAYSQCNKFCMNFLI